MSNNHQTKLIKTGGRVTAMTREGVSDPTALSPDGAKDHAKRFSGPGTRSKDTAKFDRNAHLGKKAKAAA